MMSLHCTYDNVICSGLSVPAWLAAQTDGKSSALDGPGVTCEMTLTAQGRCSGSWHSRLEASSPVRGWFPL